MKNDNLNKDFIKKCRNIDFSAESINQEKNLEILKTKLLNLDKERDIIMNKKIKKPMAFVAVVASLLCLSMAVYGQDLVRIIKTITLGNYAQYNVVEYSGDAVPLPENLAGQLFDKDGKALISYPENNVMYNANGQEVTVYFDEIGAKIATIEEFEKMHDFTTVDFYDMKEGQSYFISDTLMPTYLPDGYSFKNISFYVDSKEKLSTEDGANKYMNVYYSNGKDEIYSQVRFMDEESAFGSSASENIQKTKINGHDVVIDQNELDIQIGDVMYMFFANDKLNVDELVKIAESLK